MKKISYTRKMRGSEHKGLRLKYNTPTIKNIWEKALVFILILSLTASCAPQSKKSYFKKYKDFITEIKEKSEEYSDKDWIKANKKFDKFNTDWYNKFEDEFTWKEESILLKYKFQYNFKKSKVISKAQFESLIKNDIEQLKEQIKYYSENNMNDDIEFLLDQARDLSETATKTIEDILNEFDIDIKDQEKNN